MPYFLQLQLKIKAPSTVLKYQSCWLRWLLRAFLSLSCTCFPPNHLHVALLKWRTTPLRRALVLSWYACGNQSLDNKKFNHVLSGDRPLIKDLLLASLCKALTVTWCQKWANATSQQVFSHILTEICAVYIAEKLLDTSEPGRANNVTSRAG